MPIKVANKSFDNIVKNIIKIPATIPASAQKTIKATDNTIYKIVEKQIKLFGDKANLNHIDVSDVANMHYLFHKSKFDGDISKWNTSKVENMSWMFF